MKFRTLTHRQEYLIAQDFQGGRLLLSEICQKWDVSEEQAKEIQGRTSYIIEKGPFGDRVPPQHVKKVEKESKKTKTEKDGTSDQQKEIGQTSGSISYKTIVFLGMLLFCFPAALIYMWLSLDWKRNSKIVWTVVFAFPVMLFGVFTAVNETYYYIEAESDAYHAADKELKNRQFIDIQPEKLIRSVKDKSLTLQKKKQLWRSTYESRWVTWEGVIESVYTHSESEECKIRLHPVEYDSITINVTIKGMDYNDANLLKKEKGKQITVSGRLSGFYFLTDWIELSDAILVSDQE